MAQYPFPAKWLAEAATYGLTEDDFLAIPNVTRVGSEIVAWNRTADSRADVLFAEAKARHERAAQPAPAAPLATASQVSYILDLLARRDRNGDGGGFLSGPTDQAEIAKLTKRQASLYIDSLREVY